MGKKSKNKIPINTLQSEIKKQLIRINIDDLRKLDGSEVFEPIPQNSQPYLSIVTTTRNDDHGGNLLHRMQLFIDGVLALSEKYRLNCELIIVEWNPPSERPRLAEALIWPKQHSFCLMRIIEVPRKIHNRYKHADRLPLYQMIGKNVGIQRATGKFILATNVDILFSEELFAFISTDKMTENRMYRLDRYDVDGEIPLDFSIEEKLDLCAGNVIRINKRDMSQNIRTGDCHLVYPSNEADRSAIIRAKLHTNGCGDFTMMARKNWHELRGYPEWDMFSFHLDSVLCYMAHFSGATEEVLADPIRCYHIEHHAGWTPEIHKKMILRKRLEDNQIPQLSNTEFDKFAVKMTLENQAIIFNDEKWGLAGEDLFETHPVQTTWAASTARELPERVQSPGHVDDFCPNKNQEPYISIVVTARNDDHGRNMIHRIQVFVNSLCHQCKKYNLNAELIVVEWNPPQNKKRISQVIDWPIELSPLTVRFIEVPPEIHDQIGNADKIPLFQMIAKNVGIRRAKGKFVLATNIDIIFSGELMWFLSRRLLDENSFYRISRYDVGSKIIPTNITVGKQLEFCQSNLVRIQGLNGTKDLNKIETESEFNQWCDEFIGLSDEKIRMFFEKRGKDRKLFTNACGDFTLMARDKWLAIKCHPELPKWSIYVDGLLLHMAYVSGLPQVILPDPMRIYHIEHEMGWAVIQDTVKKRPSLDYHNEYLPWCQKMLHEKQPLNPNDENWGLAQHELKEYSVGGTIARSDLREEKDGDTHTSDMFQEWITKFELAQNRLYYRDQTPESLNDLVKLVDKYKPTKIVELGTLSGLSLRTWLSTDTDVEIIAIDLSFEALRQSQQTIRFDLSKVRLLEQDILKTDFCRLWGPGDKVLLYIDAHDQPNVPIMDYLLRNAVPALPFGSIAVVDDLWHSPATLSSETALQFFRNTVINEIDPLQCFQGYYAPYWKGGSLFGFHEVIPLMEWVNKNQIDLVFKRGIKSVAFELEKIAGDNPVFDSKEFERLCGDVKYNPVEILHNRGKDYTQGDQKIDEIYKQGTELYAKGRMDLALVCFQRTSDSSPSMTGAYYAQGVILARSGKIKEAMQVLEKEAANPSPHPNAQILLEDIHAWMDKGKRTGAVGISPKGMEPITIFAMPKRFMGHTGIIQRNAIKSWTLLQPRPEIILFGDDEGTSEIANEFGLCHVPNVKHNEYGTPLVNDLFDQAESMATHNILAYINADIILMSDFMPAVNRVRTQFAEFLTIGQRWDVDIHAPLNFEDSTWEDYLHKIVSKSGSLHIPRGLDYFVFSKYLWKNVPAFAIGRTAWDNWLAYQPIVDQHPVVDASGSVIAIHQNHDYSHFAANKDEAWKGEEARNNQYIAGEQVCKGMGSAFDATWQLTKGSLEQRVQPQYVSQHKELFFKLEQNNWTRKYLSYQPYFEYVSYLNRIQSPSISIVVISWRFCHDTIKNFQIIQQQRDKDFELIFVNNGGSPGEFDRLKPFIDTYIKLSENTGAYFSRNIGALFKNAPILLFLDDDGIPETNIIEAHLNAFKKNNVVAVRGVCLPKTDNHLNNLAKHYYLGSKPFPIYAAIEGNSSYLADAFFKAGGWDDEINFGGGGIDLSIRLLNIEPDMRKQIYSPEPIIYHDYVRDEDHLKTKREKQLRSFERLRKKHHIFDSFQRKWDRFYGRSELVIKKETNYDSAKLEVFIEKKKLLIDINHFYKLGDLNQTERLFSRYQNLLKEGI